MKSATKLQISILALSVFTILILSEIPAFSIPLWVASTNTTTPASPATYSATANYSFTQNWTDSNNALSNTTFQLGLPSGALTNYADNTTGLVGYWRLNAVNGTNYTKDFSGYGNEENV